MNNLDKSIELLITNNTIKIIESMLNNNMVIMDYVIDIFLKMDIQNLNLNLNKIIKVFIDYGIDEDTSNKIFEKIISYHKILDLNRNLFDELTKNIDLTRYLNYGYFFPDDLFFSYAENILISDEIKIETFYLNISDEKMKYIHIDNYDDNLSIDKIFNYLHESVNYGNNMLFNFYCNKIFNSNDNKYINLCMLEIVCSNMLMDDYIWNIPDDYIMDERTSLMFNLIFQSSFQTSKNKFLIDIFEKYRNNNIKIYYYPLNNLFDNDSITLHYDIEELMLNRADVKDFKKLIKSNMKFIDKILENPYDLE